MDVVDRVPHVNFIQVYQWNPFSCLYIHKEDFSLFRISSNNEGKDVFIIAVAKLHEKTSLGTLDRLPLDLVEIVVSLEDCAVTNYIWNYVSI